MAARSLRHDRPGAESLYVYTRFMAPTLNLATTARPSNLAEAHAQTIILKYIVKQ